MPAIPRIVVVDATHEVVRIVQGALALLNRQYILIEVPTSEAALAEILNSMIDLVVTAYRIPGEMHGIELATQVNHESLGTPVIILADGNDPQVDPQALEDAPFQYFMRPVAGPFLRGLRIALDGDAAILAEERASISEIDLGVVPEIDIEALREVVVPLMRDVGAMGVILADRTGRVLIDQGATGYIDRESLAAILGPAFARSADVSPLVGGDVWTMHYYDGERLDVFGLSLGIHYFICLIFDGANRGAFGAVTMFGRRAADQMIEMMGDVAFLTRKLEPLPPPKEKEVVPEVAVPVAQEASGKTEALEAVLDETPSSEPILDPVVDFDADTLFTQAIDESLADSMFELDTLSGLAESLSAEAGDRVGYDEAVSMGILDE